MITRPICPRCDTALLEDFNEAHCPTCGWRDWHHEMTPPPVPRHRPTLPTFVLHHAPTDPNTPPSPDAIMTMRKHPINGRPPSPHVSCPFCGHTMTRDSQIKLLPNHRYECTRRHRITVVRNPAGHPTAWR